MKHALTEPLPLTSEERGRLKDEQRVKLRGHLNQCRKVLELLRSGGARSKAKAVAMVAAEYHTTSADRLRKRFDAWLKEGERALVDHRQCGERGCGFPECGNRTRGSRIPTGVIDAWWNIAKDNKHISKKGTVVLRWAWGQLLEKLYAGERLGDWGDWRKLWVDTHPGEPMPANCPWSRIHPPTGWSYSNFMQHKDRPSEDVMAAGQRGLRAVQKALPEVRKDYSALRPGEVIFIDDKRFDFKVWCVVDGVPQLVELWSLCAMDAATRRIIRVGLHPRFKKPDGTVQGIERRDVRHLIGAIMATMGIPREWTMEIVAENAAAAISDEDEELFNTRFGDRVKIRRTGIMIGGTMVSGFSERLGSPNGKAVLESFFGHRLDVALGGIRGQMGSHYLLKPGELEGRERLALTLMKKLEGRATRDEFAKMMPFDSLEKALPQVQEAIHFIETNREHDLQGFEPLMLWRADQGDGEWKPMSHPRMVALRAKFGDEFVNAMLAEPGLSFVGKESVRDRWARLYVPEQFERLSAESLHEIWLDVARAKYTGNGELIADLGRGKKFYFAGVAHSARAGEEVLIRFDADAPELGAVIQTPELRVLGRMEHAGRVVYGDEAGLNEAIKRRGAAIGRTLNEIDTRTFSRDQRLALLEEQDAKLLALRTIEERTALRMTATDEDRDLNAAMSGEETTHEARQRAEADTMLDLEEEAARDRARRLAADA